MHINTHTLLGKTTTNKTTKEPQAATAELKEAEEPTKRKLKRKEEKNKKKGHKQPDYSVDCTLPQAERPAPTPPLGTVRAGCESAWQQDTQGLCHTLTPQGQQSSIAHP